MRSIVIHYQEIFLKGRNRPWFIHRLIRNLREAVSDLDIIKIRTLMGRIEILLGPDANWDEVRDRLERLFGIANFALAGRASTDLNDLAKSIIRDLGEQPSPSFRVSVQRTDKRFSLTSPQIERELGTRIQAVHAWPVNLSQPELTIHVKVLQTEAFYYFEKEKGAGGLPTGSSGRVLCLMSGGIDSPVAAYRMMKRGCRVRFLHFHSYPFVSSTSQEKVREIIQLLTKYQLRSCLHIVAFGEIQRQVVVSVPPPMRVIIYRRLMMRIADRLARKSGSRALVTGESVGQVASQTIENLAVINAVTLLPVLRPLVGFDKEEIITEAKRIDTYPVSIIPDEDCCQLFTPKHPMTKSRFREIEHAEKELAIDQLVEQAVASSVQENYRFPKKVVMSSKGLS